MKPYTVAVDINLSRNDVLERFDNPDNLFQWQTGLQSYELISGEPGQNGARTKLVYLNGKHRIELVETITNRNFPNEFDGRYEWGGGCNTLKNRFIQTGGNRTRWESTCEYEFRTLFLKMMGFIMPGKFKEQNQKFMDNFKAFCENRTSH